MYVAIYGFNYKVTSDTTVTITKYLGNEIEATVPEKIGAYIVNKIGNAAFQDKKTIQEITLPETITSKYDVDFVTTLQSQLDLVALTMLHKFKKIVRLFKNAMNI